MKNTVLVTGGAGFIGSHTCKALLKNGYRVGVIDNFNDYYSPKIKRDNIKQIELILQNEGINKDDFILFEGDIRDAAFVINVFDKLRPQAVIHLAACAGVRPSIENPELYITTNIDGTVNILQAMVKYNVKRHVFASSSSVYGNNKKVPFSESDPVDNPISPYAATKKSGELICHTYHYLYNISTACLRFFTVYGPRQRPDLAINKFTKLMLEDKEIPVFGDGTTRRDYTFIDDIVDGVMKALIWTDGEIKYDIFNLGENNTVTLNQMIKSIERSLNMKAKINRLPEQSGDVKQTWADIEKSKRILGYNPSTAFDDGIDKFIKWYKDYGCNIE